MHGDDFIIKVENIIQFKKNKIEIHFYLNKTAEFISKILNINLRTEKKI
jgi:hypothetical protein